MTTGGYTLLEPPRPAQKLVHVHAGAEELGRVYAADLLLQSSMACAAKALETLAPPPSCRGATWTARGARRLRGEPDAARRCEPLDMAEVVKTLQRLAPEDAVYTNGAGNFSGWLHRYLPLPGPAAPRPHAARADLGRDGLRRAGRGGREPAVPAAHRRSTSPATATS